MNVAIPMGKFMANSQGHGAMASMAADSDGPATDAIATTVALRPTPSPRCRRGYINFTTEVLTLIIIAAPIPWNMRDMTSITNE